MTRPVIPFDPPALTTPTPAQLSAEQLFQIESARRAAAKIRKAVRVARFDGWTVGIFGGLTIMTGFLGSFSTVVAGLIMVFVAYIELRGADGLAKLRPESIKMLSLNQVAFGSLLLLYGLWGVFSEVSGRANAARASDPLVSQISQMTNGLDVDVSSTASEVMMLVYVVIIAEAILCQGGLALYYYRRKMNLNAFLSETPPWILAMLNAGMSL